MLTPQEVSERAFTKASFGGYNMAQVDEFLDVLTGDYTALFNENAVLKSKMKVLVDKVEEYRSTEDAMRKALMAAQRMADDLVQEAERKKAELLANTESEVRARKRELERELEAEEFRLKQAQQATAGFVEKVRALHAQEADYLARLEDLYPPETKPIVDPVEEKAAEIDDNVQRLLNQAMEAAAAERIRAKAAAEEEKEEKDLSDTAEFTPGAPAPEKAAPRRSGEDEEDGAPPVSGGRIDFGKLQDHFGRDYEIT